MKNHVSTEVLPLLSQFQLYSPETLLPPASASVTSLLHFLLQLSSDVAIDTCADVFFVE